MGAGVCLQGVCLSGVCLRVDLLPTPPVLTSSDGHCSDRHASYWNAFLLRDMFVNFFNINPDHNLEWSSTNQIAVGLDNVACVLDCTTGKSFEFAEELDGSLSVQEEDGPREGGPVTTVAWDPEGRLLAMSNEPGVIKVSFYFV